MLELTFSMIKPDAVKRNLTSEIQECLKNSGLTILMHKTIQITEEIAKNFYTEHKDKPFFATMIKNICDGNVVIQILGGEGAILKNRQIMGATNPKDAATGTIRQKYGIDIDFNSVHGSDSEISAERELKIFFSEEEIDDAKTALQVLVK